MRRKISMQHTMVKHEVKIEAEGGYAVATPKTLDANVGDIVQFGTSQTKFRVRFNNWPFKESGDEVTTSALLTFEREGPFEFYCYVTPKNGTAELIYRKGSGGNGNVTKP
jgi:plastocyanin